MNNTRFLIRYFENEKEIFINTASFGAVSLFYLTKIAPDKTPNYDIFIFNGVFVNTKINVNQDSDPIEVLKTLETYIKED